MVVALKPFYSILELNYPWLIGGIETRRTDYQIIKWPSTIQLVGVWFAQDSRGENISNLCFTFDIK
jgi:hypothetical protein